MRNLLAAIICILAGASLYTLGRAVTDHSNGVPITEEHTRWILVDTLVNVASLGASYTGDPAPPVADMIICAGQSNALGYLTTPSELPSYLVNPDWNVKIWDNIHGGWMKMIPGTNTGTPANPNNFGPESEFAYRWTLDNPGKTLYVVKSVKGSTPLNPDPGLDWAPSSHELFDDCANASEDAQDALVNAGFVPRVRAILWMQGEQDATNLTYANNYQANLAALFTAMRDEWADDLTSIIVGRLSSNQTGLTYRATVRTAQTLATMGDLNSFLIDTDSYPLRVDNLHFTGAGQIMMGADMYAATLALAQLHPHRHWRGADQWDAREARPHDDRLACEHPDRGHQPLARPGRLVEEVFEFGGVDLAVSATLNSDGEAVDAGFRVQRAISSQREERSHESLIRQGNRH